MRIEDEIKGRFRNEYHKGAINLIFTVRNFSYQFLKFMKKHGLTDPQYNVLRVLRGFQSDGPASIGLLKERMLDKSSDVSRIVDRLLEKDLVDRIDNKTENSYTSKLFRKGINKVAQKVGEEAVELIIEAKDNDGDLFKNEAADLLYHYLILLKAKGFKFEDIEGVLLGRSK